MSKRIAFFHRHPSSPQAINKSVENSSPGDRADAQMGKKPIHDDESEEDSGNGMILLDSTPSHALLPQQRRLVQGASRLGNMRFETGLPTPSYFQFEKLGKTQKAMVVPNAKQVAASKQSSLQLKADTAAHMPRKVNSGAVLHRKGAGGGITGMKTTQGVYERDKEREQDAKMLLMRNYMDPKRFYKGLEGLAPDFQVGTVIEGRMDPMHARMPRRDRKRTFVDEILADRGVRRYSKKKFL